MIGQIGISCIIFGKKYFLWIYWLNSFAFFYNFEADNQKKKDYE